MGAHSPNEGKNLADFGRWGAPQGVKYTADNYGGKLINPQDTGWKGKFLRIMEELGVTPGSLTRIGVRGGGPTLNVHQLLVGFLRRNYKQTQRGRKVIPLGWLYSSDVVPTSLFYEIEGSAGIPCYRDRESDMVINPKDTWRKFNGWTFQEAVNVYGLETADAFFNTLGQLPYFLHVCKGSIWEEIEGGLLDEGELLDMDFEAFVAYAITENLHEVHEAWRAMLQSIRPGGYWVSVGFLGSKGSYPAGDEEFAATLLTEEIVCGFLDQMKAIGIIEDYWFETIEPESEEEKPRPGMDCTYIAVAKLAS